MTVAVGQDILAVTRLYRILVVVARCSMRLALLLILDGYLGQVLDLLELGLPLRRVEAIISVVACS